MTNNWIKIELFAKTEICVKPTQIKLKTEKITKTERYQQEDCQNLKNTTRKTEKQYKVIKQNVYKTVYVENWIFI